MTRPLRVGTRRSLLARTQSEQVAARLRDHTGAPVELVDVVTVGDVSTEPLTAIGGTGVFVSALREALLEGRVDIAVHSLKDLPTTPVDGVTLAAVPLREDPRDALVARDRLTLAELPPGAVVGTGSPRRSAQLAALGLGLTIVGLRGNVDSRLARVASGELDAVVLARAGLLRLGRADQISEVLDPLQMLPAPGQGALAVECRADDLTALTACNALEDGPSRACVAAERELLAALQGGCTAPVGALADWVEGEDGPELFLRAVAATADGTVDLRRSLTGPVTDPEELGRRLARLMLEDGAADLLGTDVPPRPHDQNDVAPGDLRRDLAAHPAPRPSGDPGSAALRESYQ